LHKLLPAVMGSIVDFPSAAAPLRMYITGDTLFFDGLAEIARRFRDIDVCVIHLGGTRIAGVLLTMDAAQGVRALQVIRPATALPVHHDDYTVFRSPLADFLRAARDADIPTDIHVLQRGESYPLGRR
jgi:L-ascorbate metabolism protein UlaG (beta-lactamase superfamily)